MKKKDKIKSLIRHELLNIFTILNLCILDNNKSGTKETLHLLKTATLLISYEDIFLGEKPNFFIQKISLEEVIETVIVIIEEDSGKTGSIILDIDDDLIINIDRYYIGEAINQILRKIINFNVKVIVRLNPEKKEINISYNENLENAMKEKNLVSCINKEDINNGNIGYQLALKILDLYGAKTKIEPNCIKISL